jgi:hypothetical protein
MIRRNSVASEPLQSADYLRSGQLFERRVTGQNAAQCRSAIRDKVFALNSKNPRPRRLL